ncbi:MAG: preprotein translocase subunit SecG [Bacteroidia bacterium]
MATLLTILAILAAIALTFIVIIQNSKGGGLSSTFGAAGASQVLGARRSSDLVEKLTWYFAGGMAILCFLATVAGKPDAPRQGLQMERSDVAAYDPGNTSPGVAPAPAAEENTADPAVQLPEDAEEGGE